MTEPQNPDRRPAAPMTRQAWTVVDAETMRALDRHTIDHLGVLGDLLMESAGRAVAAAVIEALAELPTGQERNVLVVCGTGNNGGDGLVVARHLHQWGIPVRVALLGESAAVRGDAAKNLERARSVGVGFLGAGLEVSSPGLIVDAIFGTGLSRDVSGESLNAIRRINALRAARATSLRVIAVDLPSGLSADTGQVMGDAVHADVTVTIELPKLGLVFEPGRSHAGRILVASVGIAHSAPNTLPQVELWSPAGAAARLPARPSAGHKGSFGHALLVAGSEGKTGAAALAAEAASRAGAGLVTLACPAGLNDILEVKCTEAMTAPVADTPGRAFGATAEETILALAAERDAVGLGPGLGRDPETAKLVAALATRLTCPLVLDADGLQPFAAESGLLLTREAPTVLTPHPGEAARLLGTDAAAINRDRLGAARRLAKETGSVVLLKGAGTVIASPEGRAVVNPTGGPALASGGTGDVLTGVIAAYLAQGVPTFEAAAVGAFLHGYAADRISERTGGSGLLAGDLLPELPLAAERLRAHGRDAAPEIGLVVPFPGL
jgi:NAD(P)H-hydrate epimerase